MSRTGRRIRLVLLAGLMLVVVPAAIAQQAQPGPPGQPPAAGRGKNQACFNDKEVEAEAQVRTGIQIREILRRCAELYPEGQAALKDWYTFDSENATQLQAAVQLRRQALSRIYPDRTALSQWETDSSVATMKSVQVNDGVCKATYDLMARLKKEKWAGFQYYAKLQQSLLAYELPECKK